MLTCQISGVVGFSEMLHTQPMHGSYTSCPGCLDLSSLFIMRRNGYIREISPFPPKAQDRDGPSHGCFFPLASGTRRVRCSSQLQTSWSFKQRTSTARKTKEKHSNKGLSNLVLFTFHLLLPLINALPLIWRPKLCISKN